MPCGNVEPTGRAVRGVDLQRLRVLDRRYGHRYEHEHWTFVFVVSCLGSGLYDELVTRSEQS